MTEAPKTIVTPRAPYSPDPDAQEGVDRAIARDGSGTHQDEPYGEDYPADLKIEPLASQLNTRNQTSVLEPYIAQPHPSEIPPTAPDAFADLAEADSIRKANIKEFVEDFVDLQTKNRDREEEWRERLANRGKGGAAKPKPTQQPADKPDVSGPLLKK